MIADVKQIEEKRLAAEAVRAVCAVYDLKPEALRSAYRGRNVIDARKTCAAILDEHEVEYEGIGQQLDRHRTTVYDLLRGHADLLDTDEEYRRRYEEVRNRVQQSFSHNPQG